MSVTIEQFKEAFAGQATDDCLQGRDRVVAKALKRLDRSIAAFAIGGGAGNGLQAVRDRIVARCRESRLGTGPARETAAQLDEILHQSNALVAMLERATVAKRATALAPTIETTRPVVPAGKAPEVGKTPQVALEFNVQGGGDVIQNATVVIAGETRVTDNGGMAEFLLEPGVYEYRVTAANFENLTGNVEVSATDGGERHGVVLDASNPVRSDVVVRVLDAQTRQPIVEALVWFDNDVDQTNGNGEVRIIGVARGSDPYRYMARARGYETQSDAYFHNSEDDPALLIIHLQPAAETAGGGESPTGETPPTGDAETPGGEPGTAPGTAEAGGNGSQHRSTVLRRGSRGPAVMFLQERLNREGASLEADGIFGPATQRAVRQFQQDHDLSPDGIVGPLTWGALLDSRAEGVNEGINIDAPVQQARELQGRLEQSTDPSERSQIARQLLQVYDQLAAQLARAPLGPDGFPLLTGQVQWDRNSPLAGTLDDINPFGARDSWSVYARAQGDSPRAPLRNRTLRIRMRVPADYSAFRTMVVEWIGGFVVRTRADDLVDASNLRQRHEASTIPRGTDRELLVVAELIAGTARYESVRFSLDGAPADDELDVPDPGGGGAVGDAVGGDVQVNPDDFVEENAAILILDAVGQAAGFAGMMAGAFVLELVGLGAGVFALLGGYYVFVQQLDSTLRAAGERLAREIAVRAAANLAASLRRGEYDGQQVTFNELYRHGDRSASMQARIGDWIGQARTVPNPQEFIDRLIEESIRRMASLLTQQLAAVQRHYRAELEQRARSLVPANAVNALVERVYVRNIARIRGRFLQDLAAAAMQRL